MPSLLHLLLCNWASSRHTQALSCIYGDIWNGSLGVPSGGVHIVVAPVFLDALVRRPACCYKSSTLADDKALEQEMNPFKIPACWMVGQFISEADCGQQLSFKVSRWQTPYAAPLPSRWSLCAGLREPD